MAAHRSPTARTRHPHHQPEQSGRYHPRRDTEAICHAPPPERTRRLGGHAAHKALPPSPSSRRESWTARDAVDLGEGGWDLEREILPTILSLLTWEDEGPFREGEPEHFMADMIATLKQGSAALAPNC
jgi:hypothetical protein